MLSWKKCNVSYDGLSRFCFLFLLMFLEDSVGVLYPFSFPNLQLQSRVIGWIIFWRYCIPFHHSSNNRLAYPTRKKFSSWKGHAQYNLWNWSPLHLLQPSLGYWNRSKNLLIKCRYTIRQYRALINGLKIFCSRVGQGQKKEPPKCSFEIREGYTYHLLMHEASSQAITF